MRVLISGDSHCDINHLKSLQAKKERFECDKVFVVGDYGFWPRDKGGLKFLNAVSKLDFPIYFLAGNHEDWEVLDKHVVSTDRTQEGFIEVHPNSFYAPTGLNWIWDGVKFLAVGGAYSIDRRYRTKFVSWFPQEIITEQDVADCMGAGKVDVILSHDCPKSVDLTLPLTIQQGKDFWYEENTEINRSRLQVIVEATEPKRLIHGHWHLSYTQTVMGESLLVEGLNCNQTDDYFTVLDTKDFE